jgi:hypothetical protein
MACGEGWERGHQEAAAEAGEGPSGLTEAHGWGTAQHQGLWG